MVISKSEQISARRSEVWKLYSQGLTQEEIAKELEKYHISQQTVSLDLKWLREDALNFVKDNRKQIAQEYKKVMSNLEQLRAEAWKQFRKIENKDSSVKVALYDTIQSINNNILVMLSVGDMIEMELKINNVNENTKEIKEEMNKLIEARIKRQAVF